MMMKAKLLILTLVCLTMLSSFGQKSKKKIRRKAHRATATVIKPDTSTADQEISEPEILQGVCGTILWKSGNRMPSPDRPTPKSLPVQRELFIYDLTNTTQATRQNGFYAAIVTKFIKSVKSDKEGKFCVDLPEGMYSLFVKEEGKGLYANSFDSEGNIFPIKVMHEKLSMTIFMIDYQANY
jgi:hypothetical protein